MHNPFQTKQTAQKEAMVHKQNILMMHMHKHSKIKHGDHARRYSNKF
jgi:hypothetical protein